MPANDPVEEGHYERLREWRLGQRGGQAGLHGGGKHGAQGDPAPAPAEHRGADRVRGIGPAFCEKHGDSLLETLNKIGIPRASGHDFPANSVLSKSDLL